MHQVRNDLPSASPRPLAVAVALVLASGPVFSNTLTVADGLVDVAADGQCSLIEALENANDTTTGLVHGDCAAGNPAGADVLELAPMGDYALTTPNNLTDGPNGLPSITSTVTLNGNGATIRHSIAVPQFRILHVGAAGIFAADSLSLYHGRAPATYDGGAIFNRGSVTLTHSTVSGNSADYGGGILNDSGTVDLVDTTVSNNTAYYDGGGLFNFSGTATLTNSTVSGNTAGDTSIYYGVGGGIANIFGVATLTDSTLSGNTAYYGDGGGLFNYAGTANLTGGTVTGNGADYYGGGIFQFASTVTLTNSTLSGNSAPYIGGGLGGYGGSVTLTNSTVSGNYAYLGGGVAMGPQLGPAETPMLYGKLRHGKPATGRAGPRGHRPNTDSLPPRIKRLGRAPDARWGIRNGKGTAALAGSATPDIHKAACPCPYGTLLVSDSTISGNSAYAGGGINSYGVDTRIVGSTVTGNTATYGGGVVGFYSSTNLTNSTVSDNTASIDGGGVYGIYDEQTIVNSTISGNSAGGSGGGVYSYYGITSLSNATVAANSAATAGGGLYAYSTTLSLVNTVIADSLGGGDCAQVPGALTVTNTLVEDGTCSATLSGDPTLGPLSDNGGSTLTHPLLPGSSAIDMGNQAACNALTLPDATPLTTDQRGAPRTADGGGGAICDIGAYEFVIPTLSITAVTDTVTEGGNLAYEAVIDWPAPYTLTVNYSVAGSGADPAAAADFGGAFPAGMVTIPAGSTSAPIGFGTVDDNFAEAAEGLTATLTPNPTPSAPVTSDTLSSPGTILDNDSAGFLVSPTALTINEFGGSGSFNISLTSEPVADVTVNLASGDTTECTVPPSVTIPAANWNTGVDVPVTAVDDTLLDGPQTCPVMVGPTSSGDPDYDNQNPSNVTVTVLDDDGLDDDGDGINKFIENGAPNGGDGNDDGIPDWTQGNVVSLPGAGASPYLTLAISPFCQASDVATFAEADVGVNDADFSYPLGLIQFTLACETANVTVYYHGVPQPQNSSYRKYGPTMPGNPATIAWYELPGATFGVASVAGQPTPTANFTLNDNQLGDDTGDDGLIVDQGGIAQRTSPETIPTLGSWPAMLLSALLGLLGLGAASRRRNKELR